jgi:ABC-type amino acid transport substrate-binding protein
MRAARTLGGTLDIIVTRDGDTIWRLVDLLGRSTGYIQKSSQDEFAIYPEGKAEQTMKGIKYASYLSLDDALAAIETHTRSACRHDQGKEQP